MAWKRKHCFAFWPTPYVVPGKGVLNMKQHYGTLPCGTEVSLYTISGGGLTASITDYGATLVSLTVPDDPPRSPRDSRTQWRNYWPSGPSSIILSFNK